MMIPVGVRSDYEQACAGRKVVRALKENEALDERTCWVILSEDDAELNEAVTAELIASYMESKFHSKAIVIIPTSYADELDYERLFDGKAILYRHLGAQSVRNLVKYYRLVQFAPDIIVISRNEPFAFGRWIGNFGITPTRFVRDALFFGSPINWLWWAEDPDAIPRAIAAAADTLIGNRVIVYGLTRYAGQIIHELREHEGVLVCGIADSNASKAGWNAELGLTVSLPEDALIPYSPDYVIAIVSKYADEMRARLEQLGYGDDQILEIPVSGGICAARGDSQEVLDEEFRHVLEGVELRHALGEIPLVVCQSGTGDVYYTCSMLQSYVDASCIDAFTLVVPDIPSCVRVAAAFGVERIAPRSIMQIAALYKAWEFLGGGRMGMKAVLNLGSRLPRKLHVDRCDGELSPWMHWLNCMRYQYFTFDGPCALSAPRQKTGRDVETRYRAMGFRPGRTVLLSPYANAFRSSLGETEFWELLAQRLQERGYDVATNCAANEQPIAGTEPFCVPYDEILTFLQYAGGFVGIRSGLCDIAGSAEQCTMAILYERNVGISMDMWSLRKMGLQRTAVELLYEGDVEGLLAQTLSAFPAVED